MQTQTLIEIEKDSTYTFTHFVESSNLPIVPSTATIIVMESNGTELLASTAMTIDGTTGVCTYAWDSTGNDVGMNYIVKYDLSDQNPVVRLFDIMLYPFVNNVTDDDLFSEYRGLKSNTYEDTGTAQSGSTTTLVDNNRAEADDHWNGGSIEIYQGQKVYTREITDFVQSTGTITFTPAMTVALTTEDYTLRQSYQEDIDRAGTVVQLQFKSLEKRAYLVIDSYTLKRLITYEVLKQYFFELMKAEGDEFDIKYNHYAKKYQTEMESLKMVYDADESGTVDDDEVDQTVGKMVWYR